MLLSTLLALNMSQALQFIGAEKPVPVLAFDASKAPGWWATKNYNTQASVTEDYEGTEPIDKLPVATINVFKGQEGEYATACFVMFAYYDYAVDVDQLKKDKENGYSKDMSGKNIGEDTASVDVLGEAKSFTLTKYEFIGPDSENAMKGMSYGWVGLDKGHISVSGVCPTGAELDETLPMISAVSLARQ